MDRLREPSTYAGLAIVLQALAGLFPSISLPLTHLSALCGGTAMAMREGPKNA